MARARANVTQVPREEAEKRGLGAIYFIGSRARVKIGYTGGTVGKRFAQIQTGSPEKLLPFLVLWGSRHDERELHRDFAHLRDRGEWFHLRDDLRQYILDNGGTLP
jgi:hypothetical protein